MGCEVKIDMGSQIKHGFWELIKENIHPGTAGEIFFAFWTQKVNAMRGGGTKVIFRKIRQKSLV